MLLLLDTHLLLWAASEPERLSADALRYINDSENTLLFSAASVWEVAIKTGLGRDDFVVDSAIFRRGLLEAGYVELEISGEHAAAVSSLPPLHHDPFDRLLLAQARTMGVPLLTVDEKLIAYGSPVRGV